MSSSQSCDNRLDVTVFPPQALVYSSNYCLKEFRGRTTKSNATQPFRALPALLTL